MVSSYQMGLDTTPFKSLYADLDQMMQRRHRIVHEADLPSPKDTVSCPWTIEDFLKSVPLVVGCSDILWAATRVS